MKRIIISALLVAVTALSLSGCFESEAEKQAKVEEQKSKDFFDMGGPTDRSKSKGYVP